MAAENFTTKLGKGFVELPFDVKEKFGRARPAVNVSINGYVYRSTICVYGGKYFVPVRKSNQQAARVEPGDDIEVSIALDKEARIVEPPADLQTALAKNAKARARWEKLSYSHRKEHANALLEARKAETRANRLRKIVEKLASEK